MLVKLLGLVRFAFLLSCHHCLLVGLRNILTSLTDLANKMMMMMMHLRVKS